MNKDLNRIRRDVRERFERTAIDPAAERRFETGAASALRLGYADADLGVLPRSTVDSFAGVGNPFSLGEPYEGESVLDLGCGSGVDCLIAAGRVGESGRVIGLDMTGAQAEKAAWSARESGFAHVKILLAEAERIPLRGSTIDLAISNGVWNLCPDKPRVIGELWRVLRPGGRVQMADILLDDATTPEEVAKKGAWSD